MGGSFDQGETGNWKELADKLLVLSLSDGMFQKAVVPYGLLGDIPCNQIISYVFLQSPGQLGNVPPCTCSAFCPACHHPPCLASFSFEEEHGGSISGAISGELV